MCQLILESEKRHSVSPRIRSLASFRNFTDLQLYYGEKNERIENDKTYRLITKLPFLFHSVDKPNMKPVNDSHVRYEKICLISTDRRDGHES